MTSVTRCLSTFVVVTFAAAPALVAGQFNVHTDDSDRTSCKGIQVSSDEYQTAAAEETVPAGSGALQITAPRNGGIWITGSDAATPLVRACKFVAVSQPDAAQAALAAIHVQSDGSHITASGPDGTRWMVYFIVQAPRGGELTAESTNGPISVRGFDGTLVAHAKNGPIAIKGSRGAITADTVNGPLTVAGSAGDVRVSAHNGPLGVTLDGDEWDGAGLQGSTQNGPLSVKLPAGYRSGVLIESGNHSPFSCRGCEQSSDTQEDGARRVQFGSAPERVHLRTNNGPVSVKRSTTGE